MDLMRFNKGEKIQTRSIEISTFDGGPNHIVVEGCLRDKRRIPTYHNISGKIRSPGTVHDMIIRMRIDCAALSIEDVQVEMPRTPHDDGCEQTAESLQKLKGLRLVPGFTSKVKSLLGGKRGCLHLTTLVLAMAPAILQGFWTFRSRDPESRKISSELIEKYLVDTCWVWREDGPLVNSLPKDK